MVESELRKIIDLSPDMICTINKYGKFIWVNNASAQILGFCPKELIGRAYMDFVVDSDREKTRKAEIKIMSGAEMTNFENRYYRKNGTIAPLIWSARWDRQEQMMYCVAKNASQMLESSQQLQLSEQRFKALVQDGSDLIAILDEAANYKYVSPTSQTVLGIPPENYIGKNAFDFIHPDDKENLLASFNQLATQKQVKVAPFRFKHSDGSWRWIETIATNLTDDPAVAGIVANSRDITDRVNAEEQLRASEVSYRRLFDNSPLPKWIYDLATFRILDVNETAIQHYGYSREEFLQLTLKDLRPKEHVPKLLQANENLKEKTGVIRFGVFTHQKKDGSLIEMDISGQQILYKGVSCMMVDCLDVTEKNMIQRLDKLEHEMMVQSIKVTSHLSVVLDNYLAGLEAIFPAMQASVLLSNNGRLWDFSAPSLPETYKKAINGIPIGFGEGSCGTAAYTKKRTVVSEIATDPVWVKYRELALQAKLKASWSHPIINSKGVVIATFANYYDHPKKPTSKELEIFSRAATLIGIIMESHDKSMALQASYERFNYVTKATFDTIWDWDIHANNLYWGDSYYELYGEIDENGLSEVEKVQLRLHPDEKEELLEEIKTTLKSTATKWEKEHRYLKSDGKFAYVSNKALIIRDRDKKPVRVIGAMQDISSKKEEEQRLKFMERVITNTNDAILITKAPNYPYEDPLIIYTNPAFTEMTGYTAEEVIGKSPRILYGPNSDVRELDRIQQSMRNREAVEATVINYKKNGQEFYASFSISPVVDESSQSTYWISITKNVTKQKKEEIQKKILADISQMFNKLLKLDTTLNQVLKNFAAFGGFTLAEAWLVSSDKEKINLISSYEWEDISTTFYIQENSKRTFNYGQGLPGAVWKSKQIAYWEENQDPTVFERKEYALRAGLKIIYGVPLLHNQEVIGVLLFGAVKNTKVIAGSLGFFQELGTFLGAEIKRKQLEDDLNRIFNTAPDIISIADMDGFFKRINPSACQLLGYEENELLSVPLHDLIHPEDRDKTFKELSNLSKGKFTHYFENRFVTKDGRVIWLAWTASPSVAEGLIFASAKNITEKKELSDLLERATTLARIGSWEIDVENNTLYFSKMTREIHEVGDEYIPDLNNAISFYREDVQPIVRQFIKEGLENGSAWDFELPLITAKGNERWVRSIGQADFINGKCHRLYGSFQDIHQRKVFEEQLKQSNLRFQKVTEATQDAIWDWNLVMDALYWGDGYKKLFGHEPENSLSALEAWSEHIHPEDVAAVINNLKTFISNNTENHFEAEYRLKRINGDYAHVINKGVILKNEKGINTRMVGAISDITHRKEYEVSLRKLNEKLEERAKALAASNTELEQFAYVASHDLQEPLRMITSFLGLLQKNYKDVLDEKALKYIYFSTDGAKRMRDIIMDLLEFSRIGRHGDRLKTIALQDILEDVCRLQHKRIEESRARIIWRDLPSIKSYYTPILQIFQNLISNAIKYAKPDIPPEIHINVKELEKEWLFSVEDNGIGIEETYFERIFVIFQRLHGKGEHEGTGIGLAIVKKIIENLGGRIWLESQPGKGSIFYFTLKK